MYNTKNNNLFIQYSIYYYHYCTHIETVVTLIVVNFFSCFVITRPPALRIGRNLVQVDPMSLPELFQQLRTLYNSQEVEILKS